MLGIDILLIVQNLIAEVSYKMGLSDASLTADQHGPSLPGFHRSPAGMQLFNFNIPGDEWRQVLARMKHFRPAVSFPQDHGTPHWNRIRESFEFMFAKRLKSEHFSQQLPGLF